MLARLQKAMKEKDQGFTLIELLVVIVIIGILAAIAIPLFLNQQKKGVDAGVKSDLKAAATLMETYYTENMAYPAAGTDLEATQGLKVTGENVITVAPSVGTGGGYCLKGSNPNGSRTGGETGTFYWYDSEAGGLSNSDSAPTGACA